MFVGSWAVVSLGVALSACGSAQVERVAPEAEPMSITLDVPRPLGPGEALRARVSAGVIPMGARLVVRTADGEIAGAIQPYPPLPGQKAGVHTIVVPAAAVVAGQVTLSFEVVEQPTEEKFRAPRKDEVEGVELVIVPVTR